MANCKKEHSLRSLADKYKTNYETLRQIKKEGIDLLNEAAVIARLSEDSTYVPPSLSPVIYSVIPARNTAKGLRAAIERLRECEVSAYSNYIDSLANNPNLSGRFLKEWNILLDQLRKIEESNPDIEQANSNSISKDELSKALGNLFKNLRQDLEALPAKISTVGQQTTKAELSKIIATEVSRIIESLYAWKGLNE